MNALRTNSGFSLIEVMCAIFILGVALVGLTEGITTALSSTKDSELQSTAAMFAAGQIEALRADGVLTDGATDGECGAGLSLYHWKQTISPTSTTGLHEVLVEVANTQSGKMIYELRTMLFDPNDPAFDDTGNGKTKDKDRSKGKKKKGGGN